MPWKERPKLAVLMALQMLWGLVLWFSISKHGLGVSTDAVHLLFGGLNLASGNGLTSYDGKFLILWPPLYPVLLALVHRIGGLDVLTAAGLIQAVAFLGLAFSLAVLFVRIFSENFGLSIAATVLAQVGSVVVIAFGMVGSDYVHLFLVVLLIVLTGHYVESGSGGAFVAVAAVSLLATLQRYLGVAAVATAALTIAALGPGRLGRRLGNGALLCGTTAPMGMWLAITSQLYTRRDPISLAENFSWFSRSILEWFLSPRSAKQGLELQIEILWLVFVALAATALVFARRPGRSTAPRTTHGQEGRSDPWPYLLPLLLYGLCYALAIFGSASIAYFNKLGGRFLLPLYIPLICLPVAAVDGILRRVRGASSAVLQTLGAAACYLALTSLAGAALHTTYPMILESRASGTVGGENAFNNIRWRQNPALGFWEDHRPQGDYVLFSNEPDGVAFNTRHAARPAPRRTTGPYGTVEMPLGGFRSELFESGEAVFLLWVEPNPYEYDYGPAELEAIADVQALFTSDAGDVYQLRPQHGQ